MILRRGPELSVNCARSYAPQVGLTVYVTADAAGELRAAEQPPHLARLQSKALFDENLIATGLRKANVRFRRYELRFRYWSDRCRRCQRNADKCPEYRYNVSTYRYCHVVCLDDSWTM
jgi:hypothetical protein